MLEAHRRNNSLLEDLRRRCSTNNWDGLEELGRRHGEKGRWLVGKARERRWLLEGTFELKLVALSFPSCGRASS